MYCIQNNIRGNVNVVGEKLFDYTLEGRNDSVWCTKWPGYFEFNQLTFGINVDLVSDVSPKTWVDLWMTYFIVYSRILANSTISLKSTWILFIVGYERRDNSEIILMSRNLIVVHTVPAVPYFRKNTFLCGEASELLEIENTYF